MSLLRQKKGIADGGRRWSSSRSAGKASAGWRRTSESGFILTLELLLLLTILGVVVYFALAMYQQHFVNSIDPMGGHEIKLYAGSNTTNAAFLGVSEAFGRFETPLIVYRPYTTTAGGAPGPVAALLGVHSDRFSTSPRVYYSGANCSVTPYLGDPNKNAQLRGNGQPTSELYALQGVAFALGKFNNPPSGDDTLYNTNNVAPASLTHLSGTAACTGVTALAHSTLDATPAPNTGVASIQIDVFGNGYTTAPNVTITPSCPGILTTSATATATISSIAAGGQVVSITVTNPGAGYACPPTVTIDAPAPNPPGEIQSFYDSETKSCLPVTCNLSNNLATFLTPPAFSSDLTTLFPLSYWTPSGVGTAAPVVTTQTGSNIYGPPGNEATPAPPVVNPSTGGEGSPAPNPNP